MLRWIVFLVFIKFSASACPSPESFDSKSKMLQFLPILREKGQIRSNDACWPDMVGLKCKKVNQKSAKYTWRACVTRLYLHAEYKGMFRANSYKPSENGDGQRCYLKVYGYQHSDDFHSKQIFTKITKIYNKCIKWAKTDQVITVPTITAPAKQVEETETAETFIKLKTAENNEEKPKEITKVKFPKKLEISDCLIGLYSQELSNDQCIEIALEQMDLRNAKVSDYREVNKELANHILLLGNELSSVSETAANDIQELRKAVEVLTESNQNLVALVNGLVKKNENEITK